MKQDKALVLATAESVMEAVITLSKGQGRVTAVLCPGPDGYGTRIYCWSESLAHDIESRLRADMGGWCHTTLLGAGKLWYVWKTPEMPETILAFLQ